MKFSVVAQQALIFYRQEAQLVDGIRGVGDQFAEKNFAIGIKRVDH